MRQYWINFNGKQEGPMTIEQMAQMGVDDTAYVWHSGLPDWVKITRVPELNDMLAAQGAESQPQESEPQETIATQQEVAAQEEQQAPEMPPVMPQQSGSAIPPQLSQQQVAPAAAKQIPEKAPECPPTNMAWAIITTLLCCTPAGIVGIVFAYLTKKHYRNGDYERARKMSDRGAWAIIASIILGLIFTPISCASQLAQM